MRLFLALFLVCLSGASVRAELSEEVIKLLKAKTAAGSTNSKIAANIQKYLTENQKNQWYSVHVADARPEQFMGRDPTVWISGQDGQYQTFKSDNNKYVVLHTRPYTHGHEDAPIDVQKKKLSDRKKNFRKKLLDELWSTQMEGNKKEIIRQCKSATNVYDEVHQWPAGGSADFTLVVPADANLSSDYGEIPMDIRTVMPCGDTWYEVVAGFSGH